MVIHLDCANPCNIEGYTLASLNNLDVWSTESVTDGQFIENVGIPVR